LIFRQPGWPFADRRASRPDADRGHTADHAVLLGYGNCCCRRSIKD
jgi:hypothetical protein